MLIDRRQIFTLAWKRAKAAAAGYRTLRTAFAAALRSVWALVKAAVVEEARRAVRPVQPVNTWASENPYRSAAVASRKARLGSYSAHCW